jgi:asparagine synthase (glutamine-hydrolysing)
MFAGIFGYLDAPRADAWVDVDNWQQSLYPYLTPDLTGCWRHENALLVESQVFNTPWSHHEQQIPWREDKLAIVFWGRLDNRAELASKLGLDDRPHETLTDAQLVLAGWRQWGETLPARLLGDFSLAIIDAEAHRLFLARDPVGVKPLYYWPHSKGLLFATTASAFRSLKTLEPTPDSDWMARYLLGLSMSHSQTGYREILKLPPGHHLTVNEEGHQELRCYHQWRDDAPVARRRDPVWVGAYNKILEESIRCRMPSNYPLGTENSGGIDSATITSYLARFLGEPGNDLHSFGFATCEEEPGYILETSQNANIVHNYLVSTRLESGLDFDESLQRSLHVLGYPEEHATGAVHSLFYRECQLRGIRTLFSGYGGDEVVTNPGSQLRLELLDSHNYRALWDIMPGNPALCLLRLGKAIVQRNKRPSYNAMFLGAFNERWPHQILSSEVMERLSLHEAYIEQARYDAPYRRINDLIINGWLQLPYVPSRFESGTLLAASYGIEYRWPLWDIRLIQQYLSTPSIEKMGPSGIGRYLHRRAISDTVPQRVAWKPSKDMGYARALKIRLDSGIQDAAEQARRQEAHLHPALTELIDRVKWREQIKQAQQGKAPEAFGLSFHQNTKAIRLLNNWLNDGPPD